MGIVAVNAQKNKLYKFFLSYRFYVVVVDSDMDICSPVLVNLTRLLAFPYPARSTIYKQPNISC